MEMDREDLAVFVAGEDVTFECLQIAPMGGDRSAILFLVSDDDFVTTVSLVFTVDGFEANTAAGILITDDWLMSLSAAPDGELFALEATVWAWRYRGTSWTRERLSDTDLETIWAEHPSGPIAVGSRGQVLRLAGASWTAMNAPAALQYIDIHGDARHGIYVCGELGTVHQIANNDLQPIDIQRNDTLNGIDVAPDGTIRVAGDDGICLSIANDQVFEIEAPPATYLAVRSFKGSAYWGGETGLFVENSGRLDPAGNTLIASDLRVDANFLYVAGTDTAWRFDGRAWKSLRLVYDAGFRLI